MAHDCLVPLGLKHPWVSTRTQLCTQRAVPSPVCTNQGQISGFPAQKGGMQCFLARESKSKGAPGPPVFTAVRPARSRGRGILRAV